MLTCAEADELLPGLALGIASPDEERELEAHLAGCNLHGHLSEYRDVAGQLPMSLVPRSPEQRLKNQLMARVYQDLEPRVIRVPWWRHSYSWVVAAVLAVVAIGIGARDVVVSGQLAGAPMTWQLAPSNAATTTGTLVWLPQQRTATLMLQGLSPLAGNEVYEVWLIKDGKPVPAGVLQPAADGSGSVIVKGEPTGYDLVAVTREPGPAGSSAPTTAPFVSGKLR